MRRVRDILVFLCGAALLVGALGFVTRGSCKSQDPNRVCRAARAGDIEQIRVARRHGADVDALDDCGHVPLHYAVVRGYRDVAEELLEHGADPGRVTYHGWSLLHIAARAGDAAMTELLLERGADPHARTHNGYTPLHSACYRRDTEAAAVLIEYGADIEAETDRGFTPLHVAAECGRVGLVEYLLRCGAQARRVDRDGNTPMDTAKACRAHEVVRLLAEEEARLSHIEDVDGDGDLDLLVQVDTENLEPGTLQDGYACPTGETYDGGLVEGCDEITIVPPE